MVRTFLIPEKKSVSIQLPGSFIGKRVEVIAFTVPEQTDDNAQSEITLTHYASQESLSKDWLNEDEDRAWENL